MSDEPEELDTNCDVCDKITRPALDQTETIYRSYSVPVNHYDEGDIWLDDEENRFQCCQACEVKRFNAPAMFDMLRHIVECSKCFCCESMVSQVGECYWCQAKKVIEKAGWIDPQAVTVQK